MISNTNIKSKTKTKGKPVPCSLSFPGVCVSNLTYVSVFYAFSLSLRFSLHVFSKAELLHNFDFLLPFDLCVSFPLFSEFLRKISHDEAPFKPYNGSKSRFRIIKKSLSICCPVPFLFFQFWGFPHASRTPYVYPDWNGSESLLQFSLSFPLALGSCLPLHAFFIFH